MAPVLDEISAEIAQAKDLYYRLVLLVGEARSGKTEALRALSEQKGWPLLNVNLQLSQQLLDHSEKSRPQHVSDLFDDVLAAADGDVVLLDNIEVLFDPALAQDPLRLLQGRARNRTVVAAWPGAYSGEQLTYAEPQHPEWRPYRKPDARIVLACRNASLASKSEGTKKRS